MINKISVDSEAGITSDDSEADGILTHKYQSTKKWEWSYLRKECENLGLDAFYRNYIHKMQRSYLSIILVVQVVVILSHIVVLLVENIDEPNQTVIPDAFIYAFGLLTFIICLLPAFHEDVANTTRPFLCSFLAILSQVVTDLSIPIYHAINSQYFRNLRPMYASHNLLIIYIFLPISDNIIVSLMGIMTSLAYTIVMVFVSYTSDEHQTIKVLSEVFFLICINFMGIFFRITNEIDIRRTFLDRRECVQKNLSLKFERNQEKELLLSILPEHIAEKMEKDIKSMIEKLKKPRITKNLQSLTPNPLSKRQWSAVNKLYAEKHCDVSILYADVVNYTQMTTQLPVRTLVETLHELFVKFDEASAEHNVLRIKFLGDCYYGVSGVPIKDKRHAKNCVDLGLKMISDIGELRVARRINIDMRIGVHSGYIIGGVMGSCKWQYDIWSKDVVIANKIESTGVTGKVHITGQTLELLNGEYEYESGTEIAKNDAFLVKSNVHTYLISPPNDAAAQDAEIGEEKNVASRPALKRSISYNEHHPSKKNFMMNSMEQFRDIMKQTNIEMERELERMPIGTFQLNKFFTHRKVSPQEPRRTFYGSDSFSDFEDYSYRTKKLNRISSALLRFGNPKWELPFLNQTDVLLKYSVFMSCVVLVTIFAIQVLNQSNGILFYWCTTVSTLMMLTFATLVWFKKVWDFIKPVHENDASMTIPPENRYLKALYDFSFDIMSKAVWRTVIYLCITIILVNVSLLHLIECSVEYVNEDNSCDLRAHSSCLHAWSVTQSLVLAVCTVFLFLRIHFMLKLLVALIIDGIYYYIIFHSLEVIYEVTETVNPAMDSNLAHFLKVAVATVIFHLIDRQSEYIQRVGFIWKQKLVEKKKTAMITKKTNKILVHNILPVHVAELYLSRQFRNDFYNEEYENVAVMFATVMNFETASNCIDNENNELRSLNEIICAFDEKLLTFPGHLKIEKIKVAGWSYMCACGLDPGRSDSISSYKGLVDGRRSLNTNAHLAMNSSVNATLPRTHKISLRQSNNAVITLVDFALDLMRVLKEISEENENFKEHPPLKLRVGISHGRVMAGVVGMAKPLYDIWGNSVNMASRMDSTGVPGQIQVTEDTANVLTSFGIKCDFRGEIVVKGKGLLPTFFVSINEALEFVKFNDLKVSANAFEATV